MKNVDYLHYKISLVYIILSRVFLANRKSNLDQEVQSITATHTSEWAAAILGALSWDTAGVDTLATTTYSAARASVSPRRSIRSLMISQ